MHFLLYYSAKLNLLAASVSWIRLVLNHSENLGASLMDLGLQEMLGFVDLFEDFIVKARLLMCVTSVIGSTFHMVELLMLEEYC